MSNILVVYATTEGQTAKIAEVIADTAKAHGHEATAIDLKGTAAADPNDYDATIVGGSIHMGKHDKKVIKFVERHRATLQEKPAAFYSVSLAAHGDQEEAEGYVKEFEQQTGWRPDKRALFGGALLYRDYGYLKRHLMKRIARGKPGDLGTDLSRDYVYTEWDAVRQFAEDFFAGMVGAPESPHDEQDPA